MAEFYEAAKLSLVTEGLYNNDKNDLGGETKYGISKRVYPNEDIPNLTPEKALAIYKKDYWDFYNLASINCQLLADKIFDMFLNMTPLSASMVLQLAISACNVTITLDGKLGSRTLAAANSVFPSEWLLDRLRVERVRFYLGRVNSNPTQLENLEGWVKRAIA